jgi:hypothetical protein
VDGDQLGVLTVDSHEKDLVVIASEEQSAIAATGVLGGGNTWLAVMSRPSGVSRP